MYNNKKKKNDFVGEIKIDANVANIVIERNRFLKQINGNEAILNMLSIDRLTKLEKYYDNIIKQNEQKIKRLKGSSNLCD